jgi:hypothetical protein
MGYLLAGTWSGDRFDDHPLGEFGTKRTAIDAAVLASRLDNLAERLAVVRPVSPPLAPPEPQGDDLVVEPGMRA